MDRLLGVVVIVNRKASPACFVGVGHMGSDGLIGDMNDIESLSSRINIESNPESPSVSCMTAAIDDFMWLVSN
jgi:hypothetical protein